jgi:hypothetical protein
MGALDATQGSRLLNAILTQTAGVASSVGMKVRLGSNSPTSTVNMTEITGTGYTAGGLACTFATTTGTTEATSNTTVLTWTNGSGGTWTINGIEIWDTAGSPLRWLQGTWIGAPISVANGNTFQVASGGIAVTIT